MISSVDTHIIAKLPGKRALVQRPANEGEFRPESAKERMIQELKDRDAHVRAHEASHMSSANVQTVGAPTYSYQIGPDGKAYAIGGQVTLSTGAAKTPEEALEKAKALRDAALAVGDPSAQDLAAASAASSMESEALIKLSQENKLSQSKMPQNQPGSNLQHIDFYA